MNMAKITQETYRKKFMKQGSHLRYCRSVGGLGVGIKAIGGMLFAVVWILGLMLYPNMEPTNAIMFLSVGSAVTLLIFAAGFLLEKKKVNGYISYYSKKNQYTIEEVQALDCELSGNDVVHLGTAINSSDIRSYYTITTHWLKYPLMTGYIRRLVDIAAVWYDPEPYYKGVHADAHLFMVDSKGEVLVFPMEEPFAADIINELVKRNSYIIASRYFEFKGESYDCQEQPEQIAALYRQQVEKSFA